MIHVLLALAPMTSVGASNVQSGPQSAGRPATMHVLQEFKHALMSAVLTGNEIVEPPGEEQVLGGGSANTYCQSSLNSFGTMALINFTGSLDISGSPTPATFGLITTGTPPVPQSFGMYTYGTVQTNIPFANGFLCISPFAPGIFRFTPQPLTATGILPNSIVTHPSEYAAFTPGSSWNFQLWYRNPAAGGANFNLSNGLHVNFAP